MQVPGCREVGIWFDPEAWAVCMGPDHSNAGFGDRLFADDEGHDRRAISTHKIATRIDVPEIPFVEFGKPRFGQARGHVGDGVKRCWASAQK